MSEKALATDDTLTGKSAPKTQEKREQSALRWPSAVTSGGAAYIPSQDLPAAPASAKQE
jgi:hypothetical protein